MVGIPGTTVHDVVADLLLFRELDLDMIGVGPYVPNPDTPLGASAAGREVDPESSALATCKVIALARILCPRANIPSTSALATIGPKDGRILGLAHGANVIMPDLTPVEYRRDYQIYPNKSGADLPPLEMFELICNTIASMGRVLGTGRGDSPRYQQRLAGAEPMQMTG
jgi:biotin synthase